MAEKSVLFTLSKSPAESNKIPEMERLVGDRWGGVILFQDAVLYAHEERHRKQLMDSGFAIYAMRDELEARGLPEPEGAKAIGYEDAVELIMEGYDQVVSL